MTKMILFYIIWIPAVIVITTIAAYLGLKLNQTGNKIWAIAMFALNFIPCWIVIAKLSTNLILDSLIYDVIVTVVYTIALMAFSKETKMVPMQFVAIGVMAFGVILFKVSGKH